MDSRFVIVRPHLNEPISERWSIEEIVNRHSFPGWDDFLKSQMVNLHHISEVLKVKCPAEALCPLKRNIFKVFELCRPENIKVVIVGQDPYHNIVNGEPAAMGMAFSCVLSFNPSLRNIMKEIKYEYPDYIPPENGDLTNWAKQGVFLLNTALTVEQGKAGKHLILWKPFTDAVIEFIKSVNPNCIYLLWGTPARKLIPLIGTSGIKLETSHPSPLSFEKGFHGCMHFRRCNEILASQGKSEIRW